MEYRKLGKWGAKVSSLSLGTYLTVGFTSDAGTSKALVKTALDAGINYFDTADAYNRGEAEKALGELVAGVKRSDLFILTKVWAPMSDAPNDRGLSAKHIKESCDKSLKRLGMDYVDCYMCHRPDADTPLDETILAMEDLIRAGKVIYWGVSEWPAPLMVRANELAARLGARPIAVSQPRYNLLYRYPESLLFPTTAEEGIGNVIFSPLAHGMLTGKYKPGQDAPKGSRASDDRQNLVIKAMYWTEEYKQKGQELAAIAKDFGASAAELAIAWCLRNPNVSSVILGASRVEQLQQNLKALDLQLTDDVLNRIETLYPQPEAIPQI
ncbi:MAG TPA: aldo/keto reductase family protein [Candidatus Hydrogenedentes bacterium]|jgi:aryl-alcohol dehydrogenase-like predicted oxidoreductase|nr:aldo/keto reductase family protein [Candidatus Hydrogenedentota bacterium]HNZ19323.1 aldo/keto reductase family protein [Candidatus Hydrogenedentota bacterium]HOH34667.1 aldo/keto reductase family protein [Candidatus Hydrogenedentota bacterium]HPA03801.1 aldo/keto reductase family protein [Candidatus Hydrogenedentota bacterium]HPV38241.1 aldo/keto reductase family protein [Candidatus Hydrogenedentota bacterium]